MKRTKIEVGIEKKIITGMVTCDEYLAQVASSLNPQIFESPQLKQIAKWCVKYHQRHKKAPRKNIESIFYGWESKTKLSEEKIDAVREVLESLSEDYEQLSESINVPHLIDVSADYVKQRRIEILRDTLTYDIEHGIDKNEIETEIIQFTKSNQIIGGSSGIDVLNDDDAWDRAFSKTQEPLLDWKNRPANNFFGHALSRDGLIGILAPEKRGKTWWMMQFALMGMKQRRKVALFEVGDMSESQILKRIGINLTGRPQFSKDLGEIRIPSNIRRRDGEIEIKYASKIVDHIVSNSACKKARESFKRRNGMKNDEPYLMVDIHSNSSINVAGISSIIERWHVERNFVPDIIIIDYPDILDTEPGTGSFSKRDQINETWKALRRLSQDYHCLVLAPTQADAASYSVETLGPENFSEDKRKMSHVTGMLGLNQTMEEKVRGLMRLNWIVLREHEFENDLCLNVAGCFKLGRPFCCATL